MSGFLNLRLTIVPCMLAAGVLRTIMASLAISVCARQSMEQTTFELLVANVPLRGHDLETYPGRVG